MKEIAKNNGNTTIQRLQNILRSGCFLVGGILLLTGLLYAIRWIFNYRAHIVNCFFMPWDTCTVRYLQVIRWRSYRGLIIAAAGGGLIALSQKRWQVLRFGCFLVGGILLLTGLLYAIRWGFIYRGLPNEIYCSFPTLNECLNAYRVYKQEIRWEIYKGLVIATMGGGLMALPSLLQRLALRLRYNYQNISGKT